MVSRRRPELRLTMVQLSLAPAIGWGFVLVATVSAVFRGSSPPMLNLFLFTLPGFAYVPATIAAVKLKWAVGQEESDGLMLRSLVLSGIGFVVLVVVIAIMVMTGG